MRTLQSSDTFYYSERDERQGKTKKNINILFKYIKYIECNARRIAMILQYREQHFHYIIIISLLAAIRLISHIRIINKSKNGYVDIAPRANAQTKEEKNRS